MSKKPLVAATLAVALAAGAVSTQASAADPVLGALLGAGIGAAIGHNVGGRHAGAVGGVIGAIVGSSIAADSGNYYDRGDYDNGYFAPSRVYYAPAPVYYGPPAVVYRTGPAYAHTPIGDATSPCAMTGASATAAEGGEGDRRRSPLVPAHCAVPKKGGRYIFVPVPFSRISAIGV